MRRSCCRSRWKNLMAKHDQRWRDARWKQKKRQRDLEENRREWELSEFARRADETIEHMRQFSDWAEPLIEGLDFLKEIGPGVNFAEILEGTKYRFVSQKYNGDGTYDVSFEVDVLSNDGKHEKLGVLRGTALRVTYIAGVLNVHGDIKTRIKI